MLEFFHYALGWLWYSQVFRSAHGCWKNVNIRAVLSHAVSLKTSLHFPEPVFSVLFPAVSDNGERPCVMWPTTVTYDYFPTIFSYINIIKDLEFHPHNWVFLKCFYWIQQIQWQNCFKKCILNSFWDYWSPNCHSADYTQTQKQTESEVILNSL